MCGIFGFVSDGGPFHPKLLEMIAVNTETRGCHAFGFAWVDSRNRIRSFKSAGPISRKLEMLLIARDAKMLIGHCRFATHGTPENNLNNHPHPCDGGWLVHNGVIRDHAELNEGYNLHPVTKCDSETLALLIEELDGPLIERVGVAVDECGPGPLAMMGLWHNPLRLVVARAGNPLHIARRPEGYYLASLPDSLPKPASFHDRLVVSFTIRDGHAHHVQEPIKSLVERHV